MSHTPGPWTFRKQYNLLCDEIGVDGSAVATVWTRSVHSREPGQPPSQPWPEGEANARLIAAAPELLEFVREWLADWIACGPTDSPREAQARALIAKATGKTL